MNTIQRLGYGNTILIAINGGIFLLLWHWGNPSDAAFLLAHGAMYPDAVTLGGQWWRLFTSCFLHFDMAHLLNNMLMLAAVGNYVERALHTIPYLIVYLAAGMAGNAVSLFLSWQTGDYAVSAGASGCIFGVVGSLLALALQNGGRVEGLRLRGIVLMIALSLFAGLTTSGVDNAAHIGGLAAGLLLTLLVHRRQDSSEPQELV